MNNIYLKTVLFIVLFPSIILSRGDRSPINGHYYDYKNTQTEAYSYDNALKKCTERGGYLAIITSKAEADWIINHFPAIDGWVSGNNRYNPDTYNEWRYEKSANNKAEGDYTFYETSTDSCSTYCNWYRNGIDNNETPNHSNQSLIIFNNNGEAAFKAAPPTQIRGFLCEQSPLVDSPPAQTLLQNTLLPTTGGNLTITTSIALDIVSIELKSNISNLLSPFFWYLYPNLIVNFKAGSGEWILVVITSNATYTLFSRYQPPTISYVYPSFDRSNLLTVVGNNFGNDFGLISLKSNYTVNNCKNYKLLIPHRAFTCVLIQENILFPLNVSINNVYSISYSPPIVYRQSLNISPRITQILSIQNYYDDMAPNVYNLYKLKSNYTGFISVIADANYASKLSSIINISSFPFNKIIQGLSTFNGKWIYLNDPLMNQVVIPLGKDTIQTLLPGPYYYLPYNSSLEKYLDSPPKIYSYFVQYVPKAPEIIGVLPKFPKTGSQINITLDVTGLIDSTLTCSIPGCSLSRDLNNFNQFTLNVPSGCGEDIPFTIGVEGMVSNTYKLSYLPPILASVQNSIPSTGFIGTIRGDFVNDTSLVSIYSPQTDKIVLKKVDFTKIDIEFPPLSNLYNPNNKNLTLFIALCGRNFSSLLTYFDAPLIESSMSISKGVRANVTIGGQNFVKNQLSISIGNTQCINSIFINSTTLICDIVLNEEINSNGDALSVNVSASISLTYTYVASRSIFQYIKVYVCPGDGNCKGHGTCIQDNGQCVCQREYTGYDCSIEVSSLNPIPLPVPNDKGGAILPSNSAKLQFEVNMVYLREINNNGDQLKLLTLADIKWSILNQSENLIQYLGKFDNDSCLINLDLNVIKESRAIDFAGETIILAANSIKFQVRISQWSFSSNLNKLEVIYSTETTQSSENECGTTVDKDNSDNSWFQIKSGSSIIQAKFARYLYVDTRITRSNVVLLDPIKESALYKSSAIKLLTSVQIPYFEEEGIIDPNFGLLVTSDNVQCSGKKNNWKLPVIVVCSVVGGLLVATLSIVIIKKKLRGRRILDVVKLNRL